MLSQLNDNVLEKSYKNSGNTFFIFLSFYSQFNQLNNDTIVVIPDEQTPLLPLESRIVTLNYS